MRKIILLIARAKTLSSSSQQENCRLKGHWGSSKCPWSRLNEYSYMITEWSNLVQKAERKAERFMPDLWLTSTQISQSFFRRNSLFELTLNERTNEQPSQQLWSCGVVVSILWDVYPRFGCHYIQSKMCFTEYDQPSKA